MGSPREFELQIHVSVFSREAKILDYSLRDFKCCKRDLSIIHARVEIKMELARDRTRDLLIVGRKIMQTLNSL